MRVRIKKTKNIERMIIMRNSKELSLKINEWLPVGHHINKEEQKKAEEAANNLLWLARTVSNEEMELSVTSPVCEFDKSVHINVVAKHIDIWTKEMNECFCDNVLKKASVYEIYSVEGGAIRIDLSFNNMYLPDEDFEETEESKEQAKVILETILKIEEII